MFTLTVVNRLNQHVLRYVEKRTVGPDEVARLPDTAGVVAKADRRYRGLQSIAGGAIAVVLGAVFQIANIAVVIVDDRIVTVALDSARAARRQAMAATASSLLPPAMSDAILPIPENRNVNAP